MSAKFEYWQSSHDQKWYFHLKAANGRIIAQSQGYKEKGDCKSAIDSVKNSAASASVESVESPRGLTDAEVSNEVSRLARVLREIDR